MSDCSTYLDSSVHLPRGQKSNSMVKVGGSNLGRMTSKWFGKVGTVLGANPQDGAGVDFSEGRDVVGRVPCI